MVVWLKLVAVAVLSLAIAVLTSFMSGRAMIAWRGDSYPQPVRMAVFGLAVAGNLAVFFFAFRGLALVVLGAFASRYWLVPAALLASAVAIVLLWFCLSVTSIP